MVTRIYVGDDEQYVPDLNLTVKPGDEVEFDEAPGKDDPRWATPAKAKDARKNRKVDVLDPEPTEPHPAPEAPAVTEES